MQFKSAQYLMGSKLTKAEAAFAKCMAKVGSHFTLRDIARHRLQAEYGLALRAGFYQNAGVEWSVKCGFRRKPATHSEAKPASVPI